MDTQKLIFGTTEEIKLFRQKHGLNQATFWGRVGITQSGGSRYESGRDIPMPVQYLLHITYGPEARGQRLVEFLRSWKTPAGS